MSMNREGVKRTCLDRKKKVMPLVNFEDRCSICNLGPCIYVERKTTQGKRRMNGSQRS